MMQITKKPNSFITPMTRDMGQNMLPAEKNGKLFVADFSDFYLAVSASVNDAKHRKPNSFITSMTRDMGQNMLPIVKTENFLSPIFLIFIWLQAHPKMMQTNENRIHLSHRDPRYGPKYVASSKNGKPFVANFSDFYLAVSASVNDANHRKPNSFITSVTQDMGQNMLPAVKTENVLSPIFLIFIWKIVNKNRKRTGPKTEP